MAPIVEIWVPGLPVPQGSKRVVPTTRGARAIETNASTLRPWRSAVAVEAALALGPGSEPTREPIEVDLGFAFPRPAAHYGTGRNAGSLRASAPAFKASKPDLDKLIRSVLDGLTGVVFVDDSQVVAVRASKRYGSAGVAITVEFAAVVNPHVLT